LDNCELITRIALLVRAAQEPEQFLGRYFAWQVGDLFSIRHLVTAVAISRDSETGPGVQPR
jgi:hypothetical protein